MSSQHSMSIRKVTKRKPLRMRLMCFGGAGSGASSFADWQAVAPPELEVCAVHFPSRRRPINSHENMGFSRLVPIIAGRLKDFLDLPFALFGHSLGALICFEVARYLQTHCEVSPQHLYVSACRAPQVPPLRPAISHLSNREFIEEACRNYDFPRALFENPELIELVLPNLRADFHLFEGYRYLPAPPLSCGITVFLGDNDRSLSRAALYAWREQTISGFNAYSLGGSHILSREEKDQILVAIIDALQRSRSSSMRPSRKREQWPHRRGEARAETVLDRGRVSPRRKVDCTCPRIQTRSLPPSDAGTER
jgi:medium-chain acyl-[acyl-carrier-protein] hydrolase